MSSGAPRAGGAGIGAEAGAVTVTGSADESVAYSSLHAWSEYCYAVGHAMPRALAYSQFFRQQALARVQSKRGAR